MDKKRETLKKYALLIIGTTALALSGINWHVSIAAWIAPVFLLMYARQVKKYDFLFFFVALFIAGVISQTGNNLFDLPAIDIFNGISYGIIYLLLYLLDRSLYKKANAFYYTLLFPSILILIEFSLSLIMGIWGIIAHTQFEIKPLMHLSPVFGVFGISFLVAWFGAVVNWIVEHNFEIKAIRKSVFIYGSIFILVFIGGELRVKHNTSECKTVKVATVVSDFDLHAFTHNEKEEIEKLANDNNREIPNNFFADSLVIETMIDRTIDAIKFGAKFIVWNEIALIVNAKQESTIVSQIKDICKSKKVYAVIAFLEECTEENKKPFNNVSILINPKGELEWKYKKSYLHPYAETPIINKGDSKLPIVETEYGTIGNVICADLDFHNYIRQAGEHNVDFLLVPAYDWDGIDPLHSQMACAQAIQYGFSIVRSNGMGLSVAYDYYGRQLSALNTDVSGTKIMIAEVPIKSVSTIYSSLGDIIVIVSFLFVIFLIGKMFIREKKK